MSRIVLSLAILLTSAAVHAEPDCEFTASLCEAQKKYEISDISLNETYKKIITKIRSEGFSDYLVPKDELESSLRNSQRLWLKFRESNCHAYYTLFSGGTSRNFDSVTCQAVMTKERTLFLNKIYLDGNLMGF